MIVAEQNSKNKTWTRPIVDRWSLVIVLLVLVIICAFVCGEKVRVYGFAMMSLLGVGGYITATRPARIRQQHFEGDILFKPEEGKMGYALTEYVDGVRINGKIYKAANGTDIIIESDGTVKPAGFGSAIIQKLDRAGWLSTAPDPSWEPFSYQMQQ